MDAYTPASWISVATSLGLWLILPWLGYALGHARRSRAGSRIVAWTTLVLGVLAVERAAANEPAGVRMLALCLVALAGMKAIVGYETLSRSRLRLGARAWALWSWAWPGMRPEAFAARHAPATRPGSGRTAARGAARLVTGALLFALARWVLRAADSLLAASLLALPALSLLLHFGAFDLLTAAWRRVGYDVRKPFDLPLGSTSLGEFWGRRWNLPFTDMLQRAVHRPVSRRLGSRAGLVTSFALSGLLHELAISVPSGAGFGAPTLYFLLHGALTLAERRVTFLRELVRRRGLAARTWTLAALALPAPLVFHPPFVRAVIAPLLEDG